jgi:hypothetical protein
MQQHPRAIAEVFFNPETKSLGYSFHFEGRPPHYLLDTCLTLRDALASCDPDGERIWDEASDANERAIMISRSFKPGSVLERMFSRPGSGAIVGIRPFWL